MNNIKQQVETVVGDPHYQGTIADVSAWINLQDKGFNI